MSAPPRGEPDSRMRCTESVPVTGSREPEGRMDQWRVIRVGRAIKVERVKGTAIMSTSEDARPRVVIDHRVKLKLPKALRRMWRFWG